MAANRTLEGTGYCRSVVVTDPATPTTGSPVRFGYATGVALTDEGEGGNGATYTTVDFGPGMWDLSVAAVDVNGNSAVAVGDNIYYVDADTPKLSKKNTGYFFGIAQEAITSGATATIQVHHEPSPGSGTLTAAGVTNTHLAALATGSIKIGAANRPEDLSIKDDGKILVGNGTTATSVAVSGDVTLTNAGVVTIGANAVTASKLSATMGVGFIPLDITTMRIIGSNEIQNLTEGGVPDGNTAPSLLRVSTSSDKALRIAWASSSSVETQFAPVPKPPDMDGTAALVVHLMCAKDTNTDNSVTIDVQMFDGVGDTEAGAATAALATASLTEYTASLAAGDLAEHPGFVNISLIPGTHTTDAIYLYAAWIEYTRK